MNARERYYENEIISITSDIEMAENMTEKEMQEYFNTPGLAMKALTPSFRKSVILPTSVSTTGLPDSKYSPNLVGKPYLA